MQELLLLVLVFMAGVLAGFINTLAGSGSIISLMVLSMAGLPINIANGTNRLAILLQSLVATRYFYKQKELDVRQGIKPVISSMIGSVFGALTACYLDVSHLEKIIGIAMLVIWVTLFVKPQGWLQGAEVTKKDKHSILYLIVYFLMGFYGGFVQIGMGVFLLTVLVFSSGYNLVRANAIKVFIIFSLTILSLVIFIINGQIAWVLGLVLAGGSMLGAKIAVVQSIRRGATFIRWLLIFIVGFAALYYLGVFAYLRELL